MWVKTRFFKAMFVKTRLVTLIQIMFQFKFKTNERSNLIQLVQLDIHIGPVKVDQKFSFSIFVFSISVLNSNLETRVLTTVFLGCQNLGFSAIRSWFYSLFFVHLSSKTWSFELISQQQKKVSNPAFQNSCSNPNWYWKPEKNPFQTRKRPFSGLL